MVRRFAADLRSITPGLADPGRDPARADDATDGVVILEVDVDRRPSPPDDEIVFID
jgi:hypothetical protein